MTIDNIWLWKSCSRSFWFVFRQDCYWFFFFFNEESIPILGVPGRNNTDGWQWVLRVYFQFHMLFCRPISSCSLPSRGREVLTSLFRLRIFHRMKPLHLQPAFLQGESIISLLDIWVSFSNYFFTLRYPQNLLRAESKAYFSQQLIDLAISRSLSWEQGNWIDDYGGLLSLVTSLIFLWCLTWGFYMWQKFSKPSWLSDSRVWFQIRATNGKGSSRNLLVTQQCWIKLGRQCMPPAHFPASSPYIHCEIDGHKEWSEEPHIAPHKALPGRERALWIMFFKEAHASRGRLYSTWNRAVGSRGSPGSLLLVSLVLSKEAIFKHSIIEAIHCCPGIWPCSICASMWTLSEVNGKTKGVGVWAVEWQCQSDTLLQSASINVHLCKSFPNTGKLLQKVPMTTNSQIGPPFFAVTHQPLHPSYSCVLDIFF